MNRVAALVQLLPQFITIPSGAALTEMIKGFEQLGFPSCAGAVDGTHIQIVSPSECPADYIFASRPHRLTT